MHTIRALGFLAVAMAVLPAGAGAAARAQAAAQQTAIHGTVRSGRMPISNAPVTLYRAGRTQGERPAALGVASTGADGSFGISYATQRNLAGPLYVIVGRGGAVRLASVLGPPPVPRKIVINERTTVAAGFALAQFISGRAVAGPAPGPANAAGMAGNLVDVRTGAVSAVLRTAPNGRQTSTLRTFNTLANMLVPCVRSAPRCRPLLRLAGGPRANKPRGTFAAMAEVARNPWHNVSGLFDLARTGPAPYRPVLGPHDRPDAWILALRFFGDGRSLNGPGNSAIDALGNVWVTNNYTYSRDPTAPVCGGRSLMEFTPTGRYAFGSPFTGGGLNGAGYGITIDPRGRIWASNFGFAATACTDQPPHLSVSTFAPDGRPLTPGQAAGSPGGTSRGGISWPQGTVSDERGDIWIANCGNDTVTRYAGGDSDASASLGNLGIEKPFDIAVNGRGQAFVTGNGSNTVAMLDPDGTPTARSPITAGGFDKPLGIAADSHGNMWVSNSAQVSVPCPDGDLKRTGKFSVSLISSDGVPRPKPFTGGGLAMPWGIAVDGDDNVWVANFAGRRVTELCGTTPANCPPGRTTGQAISPAHGYGFDGLQRNTSVQIDPSGNVWITNNWKTAAIPAKNPGGLHMVVYVGVAGPLRTPLIGPPRPLR